MNSKHPCIHIGFLALLLWVSPHIAFGNVQYSVMPLIIDATVEPRDIVTKKITLTNNGDQQVTVYPSVNNISLSEGGVIQEFVTPVESDRTTSLSSWIEIIRHGVDLKPKEVRSIDITFRINHNAKPGVYHAFIGFGTGRNTDEAGLQVKNGQAPGTIVTISIDEKKKEFLKLSKFIVDRFVISSENQAAVYTFTNPGDEPVTPTGEIIIYDSTGKEVGSTTINAEGISIPVGGEHVFSIPVPIEGLFGKYKAFLSAEYGSSQKASINDTSFFYVFPFKSIVILLLIVGGIVACLAWYVHRKYLDDTDADDSDRLTFHLRDNHSESKGHDLDLKQK